MGEEAKTRITVYIRQDLMEGLDRIVMDRKTAARRARQPVPSRTTLIEEALDAYLSKAPRAKRREVRGNG